MKEYLYGRTGSSAPTVTKGRRSFADALDDPGRAMKRIILPSALAGSSLLRSTRLLILRAANFWEPLFSYSTERVAASNDTETNVDLIALTYVPKLGLDESVKYRF